MAKGNFGKSFVEGLNPYLQNTSNLLTRMIMQDAQNDRENEERLAEQKRKDEERFNAENDFRVLLQGGKTKQELVPAIREKTTSKFPMKNFGNKYETENTTQEFFQPTNPIEEAIMYGRLPDDLRSAYKFHQEKNKSEKVVAPKKLATATGYNNKGEQEVFIKYDDGSEIRIPTGFKKEKKFGKESKTFDPKKFNKTLDGFTEELVKVNNLKVRAAEDKTGYINKSINLLNETNEALLRTIISEDDEMSGAINEHYDQLKDNFGLNYREIEQTKQDQVREKFIEIMKQRAVEGDISIDKFRALTLWAKFKYGYEYGQSEQQKPKSIEEILKKH